jgi:hypothetical protein
MCDWWIDQLAVVAGAGAGAGAGHTEGAESMDNSAREIDGARPDVQGKKDCDRANHEQQQDLWHSSDARVAFGPTAFEGFLHCQFCH